MSSRVTVSTARRILRQLSHDRRTVALLLAVPALLLCIVHFMFESRAESFDRVGLIMLGLFPFITMFLVTSIAMLRERTSGTLERLLTMPMDRLDLLFGYSAAFGAAAVVQSLIATVLGFGLLGLDTTGSPLLVFALAIVSAFLGVALGLLCSAFASSEFQAVQFMPAVVLPQALLCGLFVPRDEMSGWLHGVSDALPLTYAVDALRQVGSHTAATGRMWQDVAVVVGVAICSLIAAAATLRRRSG
jgi:ABC-2 type transport system permease protein